jgi:protein-disulfide isomerase
MILTFIGGYFVGHQTTSSEPAASGAEVKRVEVPVGLSPSHGDPNALVTVVEFADFQCGYCARSLPLQKRLLAEYPGRVRWVFKHFPLDSHTLAKGASRASLAAHAQGKFWEYHDRLFANRQQLSPALQEQLARELGLDLARFRVALQSDALTRLVSDDTELGRKAGVQGTPTFFINGRKVEGSMPYAELERLVREELATAGAMLRRGVARDRIYEELTRPPAAPAAAPASQPATSQPATSRRDQARQPTAQKLATSPAKEGTLYQVRPGDAPALGSAEALVTVVLFADLQCEKSAEAVQSLRALRREYGERLRIAFRHFPLARHREARAAAEASLAAHAQGKFWEFVEKLFAARDKLSRPYFLQVARELGLDLTRFHSELQSGRFAKAVTADEDDAVRFGSVGTPSLFVNGRHLRGAPPLDELRKIIREEQERAIQLMRGGVSRDQLYEKLIAAGAPRA